MFQIGEFSKLTQITIRMLRYYDEAGLWYTEPFQILLVLTLHLHNGCKKAVNMKCPPQPDKSFTVGRGTKAALKNI